MINFAEIFRDISGGRVLDVATGEGGFISVLHRCLREYSAIIGVDTNNLSLRSAASDLQNGNIQFAQMNAERLAFADESFDTVSIAASLHHLENVTRVLLEMKRSLKSGGNFIISEMHRDGITSAQFNAIRIHHWAAEVDTALGYVHDRTFSRAEILNYATELHLFNINTLDILDTDTDPWDSEDFNSVSSYIERYLQCAEKIPAGEIFIQRGEQLRRELHEIGVHKEPVLVVIGEKV